MKWLNFAGAIALTLPAAWAAAQQGDLSSSSTQQLPMPTEKTQNGATYLCGGVGVEEASQMKEKASAYDLMLSFAAKESGYLADVDVTITDEGGNQVLKTFCGAPILLVQLPDSGTYRVKAETGGYTLQRTVTVGAHSSQVASVVLLWPHQLAESLDPNPATSTGDSGTGGSSGAGSGGDEFEYRNHQ